MLNCRFVHFDPVDGLLSARLGMRFIEPLYLARQLLAGRTVGDIRAMAQILEQIRGAPDFTESRPTERGQLPMEVALESGEIVEAWPTPDDIALLEASIKRIDLTTVEAPPNLKWHELFAVLALCYVEQACAEERRLDDETAPDWARPTEALFAELVDHYAYTALRAASLGAHIQTEFNQKKATAIRGGQARRANSKPLKEAVLMLYSTRFSGRSNREAARLILDELQRTGKITIEGDTRLFFEGVLALSTDDPHKRFEKWIGVHRRAVAP